MPERLAARRRLRYRVYRFLWVNFGLLGGRAREEAFRHGLDYGGR